MDSNKRTSGPTGDPTPLPEGRSPLGGSPSLPNFFLTLVELEVLRILVEVPQMFQDHV